MTSFEYQCCIKISHSCTSHSFELDKLKLKQMRNTHFSGTHIKLQHQSLYMIYPSMVWLYNVNKKTKLQTVLTYEETELAALICTLVDLLFYIKVPITIYFDSPEVTILVLTIYLQFIPQFSYYFYSGLCI